MASVISLSLLALVATAEAPPAPAPSAVPTLQEVMGHLDRLYRSDTSRGKMEMKVRTKHFQRDLVLESWSRGEDHSLVVIRSPAREAGSATLRTPKGLWTYAPRADRMLRIPSGMLSESWMGSHFSNDDLMRESSWVDDYDTKITPKTEGGKEILELVSIPKPDAPVVYTKVVQTLTREDALSSS